MFRVQVWVVCESVGVVRTVLVLWRSLCVFVCCVCVLSGIARLNVKIGDDLLVFAQTRVGLRSLLPLTHIVTIKALARALRCLNGD